MKVLRAFVCAAILLWPGASRADQAGGEPVEFPNFKAKRVTPPSAGQVGRLINIQIDPNETPVTLRARPTAPIAPTHQVPSTRFGWFWDAVSADLAQARAGRLEDALTAINVATDPVPAPRLQDLLNIVRDRGVDILVNTIGTDVSPALVLAVISVESAGKTDAVSRVGAQGLMQLMPATAARFGVTDSLEPTQNIAGGVKYLDWLMKEFEKDPILALAGYNAGEGAVRKHKGVPPFSETRDYVPKVLAAYSVAKGLCKTPPQFASDACVFTGIN